MYVQLFALDVFLKLSLGILSVLNKGWLINIDCLRSALVTGINRDYFNAVYALFSYFLVALCDRHFVLVAYLSYSTIVFAADLVIVIFINILICILQQIINFHLSLHCFIEYILCISVFFHFSSVLRKSTFGGCSGWSDELRLTFNKIIYLFLPLIMLYFSHSGNIGAFLRRKSMIYISNIGLHSIQLLSISFPSILV